MKKIIKYILLAIIPTTLFLSCSADSTQGMLSRIIESQEETSYRIKLSSFNTSGEYFVSSESDGIYKEAKDSTSTDVVRTEYANSDSIRNIIAIYTNNDTTYLVYNQIDEEIATPTLMSFDNSDVNNTVYTDIGLTSGNSIITITENGYLITKNSADKYELYDLTVGTSSSIPLSTISGDFYDYAVFNPSDTSHRGLIITTATGYYYFNGSTTDNFDISIDDDDEYSTVVAAHGSTTDAILITYSGFSYSGEISEGTTLSLNYDNDDDDNTFSLHLPVIGISDATDGNYLLAMDSDDYIYIYSESDSDRYNTYSDKVMDYASDLNGSSNIVYIYEKSTSATENIYWIATEENGFYTIKIDPTAVTSSSDYHSSDSGLSD